MSICLRLGVLLASLIGVAAYAVPYSFGDVPNGPSMPAETQGAEWEIVSPPGLPPGALPSPEGGFVIPPENIGMPEVGGYQWASPEAYENDWLAFMLASNALLLGGAEEEGEWEFPAMAAHAPGALTEAVPDEAVPEPASFLSIVIGGALIVFMRRRV